MSELPQRLGVVGAGTMGSGIAQLGCLAGIPTVLHDPLPDALERGAEGLRRGLAKGAERGRWTAEDAEAGAARLETAAELDGLADCDLVIEAAPERPALKRDLFASLSGVCGPDAVLATNTSSIPVTSLASAAARPENVVGMHFFNPAPLMRLVEVIAAEQSSERALALATATGEAMGKRVIRAFDGPGFLVNRCGRPFGAEALRLVQERVATPQQVDRICRLGGGFRMGPFELMDLVGIDVGFEVAKSFTELSFGEPRWKPSPLQARMVAAGRLGRKAGRGWYEYGDGPHRPDDPEPPAVGGGQGRTVVIHGETRLAAELLQRAQGAGFDARGEEVDAELPADVHLAIDAEGGAAWAVPVVSGQRIDEPVLKTCTGGSLVHSGGSEACGFSLVPPFDGVHLVELVRGPQMPDATARAAEEFFTCLGMHQEWVEDAPGLVLARIVSQLVNEACFAVGEGVGSREDVDAGMTLGLNHPRGPMAWGEAMGFEQVLATIDGLWHERREERYRPAPFLRRLAGGD